MIQREHLTPLLLTLCDEYGKEIERAIAVTGRCALKAALLMLAKRDALRRGDVLRAEADELTTAVTFAAG